MMARPKEKVSAAFQQKCQAAADKLRKFQAEKLSSDMERLFSEQTLADITVELLNTTLSLHSCILRARTKDLYDYLISLSDGCRGESHISLVKFGRQEEFTKIFKALYTEEDITSWLRQLETIFAEDHASDKDIVNGVAEFQNKTDESTISEKVQDPISLKKLEEEIVLNGIDDLEVGEDGLYDIAEKIVQKSIQEAKAILESNKQNDEDVDLKNLKVSELDINISVNDDVSHYNEMNVAPANGLKTNTENTAKSISLRRTKDRNKESVQCLAERTLGTKMNFEPCSELGEDLLRTLLDGDSCDHDVIVQGKKFRVHSCILAARSSYFEAMLGGCWRESDAEEIVLEGVEPEVMRQMLLYLYGGVIEVDSSCTVGNLVMMSDMYSMEGLKEVVAFNLNKDYCHFFHRPCSGCISGVPDTLALTMMYNMDTLKEKCVKWINKNFDKVWPTKTFALLPQEVLEFCISSAVKDLALDNVIDIMVECRKLNETTPRLRWSEPVFDMITLLMDGSIEYASQTFVPLVSSKNFRKLNEQGIAFNRQPLEDIFGMVITALSPENACQSYLSLNKWVAMVKPKEEEQEASLYSQEFWEFVEYLFKKCKEHLCMYIHQAANTAEWGLLTKDMQQELISEANYVFIDDPNKSRVARPKLTSMQKKITTTSPLSLKEYFDRHFGSKEHIQSAPKASAKPQLKGTRGRTPTPSTGASSKVRKNVTEKSVQDSSKVRKQEQGRTTGRNIGAKFEQKTQTKSSGPKDSGSIKYEPRSHGDSSRYTGPQKKSLLPRSKAQKKDTEKAAAAAAGGDKDEDTGDAEGGTTPLEELEDQLRPRSNSAATFIPRFGQSAALRSAQSMDSFFDSRQGMNCSIQRPLPVFEVKFIVPHEFFESF